jgi:pimeloyl-ACP methyl ester carboxylesterase
MFDPYQAARRVKAAGVDISVTEHGPVDGTPVLLIHGFPDSARLWRNQIPVLAEAGYRVIAPDLRGFGRSDAPEDVADYDMAVMIGDMLSVLDDCAVERAHVVGHDWGAALTWSLGRFAPERVLSISVISVGHPGGFIAAGLRQREKSWYMLLFQFESIAERWLSDNDWHWLRRWGGAAEADNWVADLSRPGRLTAALNVYRANLPPETVLAGPRKYPPVTVPVLGIWSTGDGALTEKQMTASSDFVAGEWRYERIEDCGHWIPLDAPDRLNELLLEWLGSRAQVDQTAGGR